MVESAGDVDDGDIITTRTYQDRLETLDHVREAGMKICSGGIVGMGEAARLARELFDKRLDH